MSVMDQELSEKKGVVSLGLVNGSVSNEMVENSAVSDIRVAVEMRVVEEEKVCENKDVINHDVVSKMKVNVLDDDKCSSCVIDVKNGESLDVEWVCRICHLSSDQSLESTSTSASTSTSNEKELIQLGCGCKDELGAAHSYCAEAWFKLKGNRY